VSYSATFNDGRSVQAGTTKGWNDFTRWAETLDAEEYPELAHLAEYGWSQDLTELTSQLADALDSDAPSDPDTADVAKGLLDFLKGRGDAEVVTVG
jgi:hypothetical protein